MCRPPLAACVLLSLTLSACGDHTLLPRGGEAPERADPLPLPWYGAGDPFDGGQLLIEPDPIGFEVLELGELAYREITLSNIGTDDLVVFRIQSSGERTADLWPVDADLPLGIQVGERIPITLAYLPTDCESAQGTLVVDWSDRRAPRLGVPVSANGLVGAMAVSPDEIRFGRVGANNRVTREVVVTNEGSCPLHIEELELAGSPSFLLTGPDGADVPYVPELPIVVTRDEPLVFEVTYDAVEDVPESGTLYIGAREEPEKEEVPLFANQRECPTAVAGGYIEDLGDTELVHELAAIPLQTVRLDARGSSDPDGQVAGYRWRVVERPQDSTSILFPSAEMRNPSFFLDLAGDYAFELTVFDNDGERSCQTDTVRVSAIPDEDIHVQLVWRTHGDPNEGDGVGTDLDLHFLRMPGSWDVQPWDCHWKNMEPDWAGPGRADDPSLDIDDVDELGPENINLSDPENGRRYAIGVYYYSDDGLGPSLATVRVFINGDQVFEIADRELSRTGVFWEVGEITWPADEVRAVDLIHMFGFP